MKKQNQNQNQNTNNQQPRRKETVMRNLITTLTVLVTATLGLVACGGADAISVAAPKLNVSVELSEALADGEVAPTCVFSVSGTCYGDQKVLEQSSDSFSAPGNVEFTLCEGDFNVTYSCAPATAWEIDVAMTETNVVVGANGASAKGTLKRVPVVVTPPDNQRPLVLVSLTSANDLAKSTLHTEKVALDASTLGFSSNPSTVTDTQLATQKGKTEVRQGDCITTANKLSDEIDEANRRNTPADNADLVAANTSLGFARTEISEAQTSIELAALAISAVNGSVNLNTRIGQADICLLDVTTGADATGTVTEVAVGVNNPWTGTGCFRITGLPTNRPLRFKIVSAGYMVVLQPISPLIDDIPVAVTIFMWPDIAEGALYMGPDPMFAVAVGGSALDISGVQIYQKVSGALVPVAATCSHSALVDVAAVTSDCHTVTPGGVAGCEKATVSYGTATPITFKMFNYLNGVAGNCP